MGVSKHMGIPKSSILIGFSIINHPFEGSWFWGSKGGLVTGFFCLLMGLRLAMDSMCEKVTSVFSNW